MMTDDIERKNLLSLFLTTRVDDHVPRGTTGDVITRKVGPVLVLERDETLPRAFRKLIVEGFLSAPVVEGKRFIGFIDMMDLVQKTRDMFWGDTVEAWTNFWEKEEKFTEATVDDLMKLPNTWDRDPSPPIGDDFTTFQALEWMVRKKLHRLAIVKSKTNRLKGILTQSMLISWLRQNKALFGALATMRVCDMVEELKSDCRTVLETSKVVNAFSEMANLEISGMAVVDSEGILVDSISIRDLRTVGSSGEYFHRLFRTIKEFKTLARDDHPRLAPSTHYARQRVPRKGLFVTPTMTFTNVIDKMADGNIHRVFVCDSSDRPRPTHVISQVDVLRVVLDHIISEAGKLE